MTFTRHPVDNPVITQPWGENRTGGVIPDQYGTPVQQLVFNYGNYQPHGHDGIDYGCPIGTPVYAPGPGVIEYSGWGQDMPEHIAVKYGFVYGPGGWPSGILVCIDHGGIGSYVAHLSASYYEAGQRVNAGTLIGLSDTTGRSGGPHVHFSAIRFPVNYTDGLYSRVNPLPLFSTITNVPIRPGPTGDPATPNMQEWYLMPDIPKDNLLQIVAALKSVDFGAWLQAQVMSAPAKSTDGKLWPLRSFLYGLTQRQQQLSGQVAGLNEAVRQVAATQGAPLDYDKITEAAKAGVQQAQLLDAKAIADAVVDEQAERLNRKEQ